MSSNIKVSLGFIKLFPSVIISVIVISLVIVAINLKERPNVKVVEKTVIQTVKEDPYTIDFKSYVIKLDGGFDNDFCNILITGDRRNLVALKILNLRIVKPGYSFETFTIDFYVAEVTDDFVILKLKSEYFMKAFDYLKNNEL